MPVYQGIKLSVISQLELRIHPEFPHPESSQFTYRSPNLRESGIISGGTCRSTSSDSKADRILGRPSTISVYIPSHPGARFWLRYDVTEAEAPHIPWYYFKLFMNGRHITSWGTNPRTKPSGQVMRALFDPSERWNYKVDGTIYKNNGTETRPFYFGNQVDGLSAANDGGLIEVRVLRAKGRQRKVPNPMEFKPQDQYGIILPSSGLVDTPQDAKYYDWHLMDPKDKPFATFKFHYRSWDSLASLQLIPTGHPRALLFPTPSLLSLNGQWLKLKSTEEEVVHCAETESGGQDDTIRSGAPRTFDVEDGYKQYLNTRTRDSSPFNRDTTPWSTQVNNDSDSSGNLDRREALQVPRSPSPYCPTLSPDALQALGFTVPPVPPLPSPTQLKWGDVLNRPLPKIPQQHSASGYSRSPPPASSTPSLMPSILKRLDQDPMSQSPSLGVATTLRILRPSQAADLIKEKQIFNTDHYLRESTEVPAPLVVSSRRQSTAIPAVGGILSNNSLRKHQTSSASKSRPQLKMYPTSNTDGQDANEREVREREPYADFDDTTPLSLTEAEWMCHTPSSTTEKAKRRQLGKMGGLEMHAHSGAMEETGSSRKKTINWRDTAGEKSAEQDETDNLTDYGNVGIPGGWV